MDVVYRIIETGDLVFAEREQAESVARIRSACAESTTWGEFKAAVRADEFAEVLDNLDADEADVDPAAAFDPDELPGYTDGNYPQWLQQSMLSWFPAELIERFGSDVDSVLNGEFLELRPEDAEAIAGALRDLGHHVEPTDLDIV